MPRVSKVAPIFIAAARSAGTQGVTIAEVTEAVWSESGGTLSTRGVEAQAKKLVAEGKLVRFYRYYYPVTAEGVQMKSPVRRYRYYTPEHALMAPRGGQFDQA